MSTPSFSPFLNIRTTSQEID
jgi:hypothetical protein